MITKSRPQEKQLLDIENLKTQFVAKVEFYKDLSIITYEKDFFFLKVYRGKRSKALCYNKFLKLEHLENHLTHYKQESDERERYFDERNKRKNEIVENVSIGDIFSCSWGYEQTNVEFYQVVGKPSKYLIEIQEIESKTVEGSNGHDSCDVTAIKDSFISDSFRKKIGHSGCLTISSCQSARLWDGKPKYRSWGH